MVDIVEKLNNIMVLFGNVLNSTSIRETPKVEAVRELLTVTPWGMFARTHPRLADFVRHELEHYLRGKEKDGPERAGPGTGPGGTRNAAKEGPQAAMDAPCEALQCSNRERAGVVALRGEQAQSGKGAGEAEDCRAENPEGKAKRRPGKARRGNASGGTTESEDNG